MSAKYELPQSITLPNGTVLSHYWSYIPGLGPTWDFMCYCSKREGAKIKKIQVLSRGLRGKRDLRGMPYKPNDWIFCSIPQHQLYRAVLQLILYFLYLLYIDSRL